MAMWNDQQKTDLAYCMGHTFEAMTASYEATGIFVRDGDTRLLGTRSDLLLLEDLCDAIAFIDTLDQTRTLDADLLCAVNGRMTRSASMYPGRIRAHGEDVFVRTPFGVFVPGTPDMVRLKDALDEGSSAADALPAACILFARLAKMQLFFDGNKRTALLVANALLRKHASTRVLLVPTEHDSRREFLRMLCAWYVEDDDAVVQWLVDFNDARDKRPGYGGSSITEHVIGDSR